MTLSPGSSPDTTTTSTPSFGPVFEYLRRPPVPPPTGRGGRPRVRQNHLTYDGLMSLTAAVVGVILNLALWFALHALFTQSSAASVPGTNLHLPELSSINVPLAALTVLSMLLTFVARWSTGRTLLVMALAGIFVNFLLGHQP